MSTAEILGLLLKVQGSKTRAPKLSIDDLYFLANGKQITLKGCTDFSMPLAVQQNRHHPVLRQRVELGFTSIRMWSSWSLSTIGTEFDYEKLGDKYYSYHLPKAVDTVLAYGLTPEVTAYVGINNPTHWTKLGQCLYPYREYILVEWTNEWEINKYKTDDYGRLLNFEDYQKLEGFICSHGSNGSQMPPVSPYWDFIDFHTNDAPEWQRKVGHNGWEFAVTSGRPCYASENTRDDHDSSVIHFEDAMMGATGFIAGAVFHSSQGKASEVFTGDTLTKAQAAITGFNRIPTYCQRGYYERLDPNGWLRLYRKGGDDACLMPIRN